MSPREVNKVPCPHPVLVWLSKHGDTPPAMYAECDSPANGIDCGWFMLHDTETTDVLVTSGQMAAYLERHANGIGQHQPNGGAA